MIQAENMCICRPSLPHNSHKNLHGVPFVTEVVQGAKALRFLTYAGVSQEMFEVRWFNPSANEHRQKCSMIRILLQIGHLSEYPTSNIQVLALLPHPDPSPIVLISLYPE